MNVRDYKYDNIRGLAIIFVVAAHLMVSATGFYVYNWLYNFFAVSSMFILFFVSGYLSKVEEDTIIKAFKRILIPYILFSILWILYIILTKNLFGLSIGSIPKTPFIYPMNALWYLLSLFFMRLMLPFLVKIKHILWISIILALFVGILDLVSFLSISKTFCLLPSFLMGYYIKNYKDELISKYRKVYQKLKVIFQNKNITVILLIIFVIIVGTIFSTFPGPAVRLALPYHDMGFGNMKGILMRLFIIISGLIITILLTNIITDKKTKLTKIGINSLAVYVLHPYITRFEIAIIDKLGFNFIFDNFISSSIFIIVSTILIIFILSRDFFTDLTNRMINFITQLILKKN